MEANDLMVGNMQITPNILLYLSSSQHFLYLQRTRAFLADKDNAGCLSITNRQ
jgi:hypothetical protein